MNWARLEIEAGTTTFVLSDVARRCTMAVGAHLITTIVPAGTAIVVVGVEINTRAAANR